VLGEPPCRLVVGIEVDLSLTLGSLLRSALRQAVPQTLTSSFSFWASAITFCATCVGTSSYRANDMW
jgi:hypothetical protein